LSLDWALVATLRSSFLSLIIIDSRQISNIHATPIFWCRDRECPVSTRKTKIWWLDTQQSSKMKKIYTIGHCTTSLALFEETGLDKLIGEKFILQNIKFEKITPAQLDEMKKMVGTYEALFSRRAIKYKEWKLKDKELTEKDYRQYILDEYTFLKRPVIIMEDKIFVGSEKKTIAALKNELK
jgi:arsenate reductase